MRKVVLMTLLALLGGCDKPNSKWVKYGYAPDDGVTHEVTVYANPASVHKIGDKAAIWLMWDYGTAQTNDNSAEGPPYLSRKYQEEYDCMHKTKRIIYEIAFSENMGDGKVVNLKDEKGKTICEPSNRNCKPLGGLFINGITLVLVDNYYKIIETGYLDTFMRSSNGQEKPARGTVNEALWKLACGK